MRSGFYLRAALLCIAAALSACSGGERPADPSPPRSAEAAFAVCAPDPDAGGETCACEDPAGKKLRKGAADGGVRSAEPMRAALDPELQIFLLKLGTACAEKDTAFLEASVRFPLRWREIVNENIDKGRPITRTHRIARPKDLCAKNVLAGVQGVDPAFPVDPASSTIRLAEDGPRCRVETLVGQFGATLLLEKTDRGWLLTAVEVDG